MYESTESGPNKVKGHVTIALAVLALVGVAYFVQTTDMDRSQATILILAVTGIQAFLVIQFLMHLVREVHAITNLALLTLLLVSALCLLSSATSHGTYGERTHQAVIEVDRAGEH